MRILNYIDDGDVDRPSGRLGCNSCCGAPSTTRRRKRR
jgi:hypothetical protein